MAISKVTSGGIADGTLSVEDIADDAVTAAKLANSINTDIATGVTGNTTANAALPKAGGAMTGAITTNSTFDGVDIATRDGILTSTTTTAGAALPKAGGTMTGDALFNDGIKAKFGTGSDLQIYHDGSKGAISDSGTGNLYVYSDQFIINNYPDTQNMARFVSGGAATLYHAGNAKLATTSTGINVTGNMSLAASDGFAYLSNVGTGNAGIYVRGIGASNILRSHSTGAFTWEVTGSEKMRIDSAGRVTMPSQPAFLAGSSSYTKAAGWQDVSVGMTSENYDIGNNYSSGNFTAPIAGRYLFFWGGYSSYSTTGSVRYGFTATINGSQQYIAGGQFSTVDSPLDSGSIVYNLSANDVVKLRMYSPSSIGVGAGSHEAYFGGYLMG